MTNISAINPPAGAVNPADKQADQAQKNSQQSSFRGLMWRRIGKGADAVAMATVIFTVVDIALLALAGTSMLSGHSNLVTNAITGVMGYVGYKVVAGVSVVAFVSSAASVKFAHMCAKNADYYLRDPASASQPVAVQDLKASNKETAVTQAANEQTAANEETAVNEETAANEETAVNTNSALKVEATATAEATNVGAAA